jgi:hypothetical protein
VPIIASAPAAQFPRAGVNRSSTNRRQEQRRVRDRPEQHHRVNGNCHAGFDVHAHVAGMNLTGNVISDNQFGLFAAGGPVTINGARDNVYEHVATVLGTSPTFS